MSEEKVSLKDFMSHIQIQAKANQDTAVALTEIRAITKEILDQTKKTNGRVNKLENEMTQIKPQVEELQKQQLERRELNKKMTWFWIERAFYFGLLIIGIILEISGKINVFK